MLCLMYINFSQIKFVTPKIHTVKSKELATILLM